MLLPPVGDSDSAVGSSKLLADCERNLSQHTDLLEGSVFFVDLDMEVSGSRLKGLIALIEMNGSKNAP